MITYKQFILENEEVEPEDETIHYPGGVYSSVKMREESIIAIKKYMENYLPGHSGPEDDNFHCTLIYSKKERKELIEPNEYDCTGTFLHFSKFGEDGATLVAEISCEPLVQRNADLVEAYGFVSDYDEYLPHFTLVYDASEVDINSLPPLDFAIQFHDETIEPLDTEWANKDKDKDDKSEDGKLDTEDGTIVGNALNKMKNDEEKEDKKSDKED